MLLVKVYKRSCAAGKTITEILCCRSREISRDPVLPVKLYQRSCAAGLQKSPEIPCCRSNYTEILCCRSPEILCCRLNNNSVTSVYMILFYILFVYNNSLYVNALVGSRGGAERVRIMHNLTHLSTTPSVYFCKRNFFVVLQ